MDHDFSKFQFIPSVRRLGDLETALCSDKEIILLTEADIVNLKPIVKKVHDAGKKAWINLELLGGFGRDTAGIKLLKNFYHVDGVMSTDSTKLGIAKKMGIFTVQRFLLVDSRAFDTAIKILKTTKVDAAEVLPGVVAQDVLMDLRNVSPIPILAGGFIRTIEEIEEIKRLGFNGLTISKKEFFGAN